MKFLFGRSFTSLLSALGFSRPRVKRFKGLLKFIKDLRAFERQKNSDLEISRFWFCLADYNDEAGTAKGDYFHQDLIIAQQIFEDKPDIHLDIGSLISGFVAHVASFREIIVMDIRPVDAKIKNMEFIQIDLMDQASVDKYRNKFSSISCLHAIEHFGLGRYGDRVDPAGHLVGLKNIKSMLRQGESRLYLSFPMGAQRIEFNAHRIFGVDYVKKWFADEGFTIERFSYVDEQGNLYRDKDLDAGAEHIASFNKHYGCGIFTLRY
ncbi:MAG: DUF268 domain-containing protein [Candidatus Obscuribacterales bacterium]|nr:DUF268 domain-containing protein [Candidatus Obscuribacterales bacterium]